MSPGLRKIGVRTVTGVTLLAVFLVLVWVPVLSRGFAALVSVFVAIGLYEYYAIVRKRAISPETIGGILGGSIVVCTGYFRSVDLTNFALYGSCLLVSALHIVRGQHSVAGLASTVFGVFYVGWFGAHFVLLHRVPEIGAGLITVLFVAVTFTDSGAFFIGSAIGKHKLSPKASPNKTWEGAIGGFLLALIGMVILHGLDTTGAIPRLPGWGFWQYVYVGMVLSLTGQVGDLAESCLKRDAGVKDSGNLFPGHGGILDRCDSILFAAPVLYYMSTPWFTVG